tara:strand:- start:1260 stop:1424 length:165 start_codon:yes stop_codon:yes gene_type:complete
MGELKINRGIELMLRGAKKKEPVKKKGFGITQVFSLLKRRVYFNFEIRWEKEDS